MSPLRHIRHYVAVVLFNLLLVTSVFAQPALWVVHNAHATVYLFGTVHLLPNDTDWRFPALEKALSASNSLTIELTDDDDAHMQALVLQYGLDPSHPLSDKLTTAENASLAQAAQTAGIPGGMQTLQMMRPWLAGVTLAMAPLVKAGLDPAHGVDKQLKAQMIQAGKPVNGMETSEQQIHFLADLPPDVELAFLRSTLHDIDKGPAELTELISAWKNGDTATIARIEDEDVRQQAPHVYQHLLVQRNQAWATARLSPCCSSPAPSSSQLAPGIWPGRTVKSASCAKWTSKQFANNAALSGTTSSGYPRTAHHSFDVIP